MGDNYKSRDVHTTGGDKCSNKCCCTLCKRARELILKGYPYARYDHVSRELESALLQVGFIEDDLIDDIIVNKWCEEKSWE